MKAEKATTFLKIIPDGTNHWIFGSNHDVELEVQTLLDTGNTLQAGKDYSIYLCYDSPSSTVHTPMSTIVVSLNGTNPSGYSDATSRKIGGFHTLCVDAGSNSGHPLSSFKAGDILPKSVWTITHRPKSNPNGMVYIDPLDFWCDIYLKSGTKTNTAVREGPCLSVCSFQLIVISETVLPADG